MNCEQLRRLVDKYGGKYVETGSYCIAYFNNDIETVLDLYYKPNRTILNRIELRRIGEEHVHGEVEEAHLRDVETIEMGILGRGEAGTVAYRARGLARRVAVYKEKSRIIII
ncbi:MAG: hypothetical protein GXO26_08035 [Crenarchaeota archaeon]|nr:hypothetical protein [Thermoproteota archaeon]